MKADCAERQVKYELNPDNVETLFKSEVKTEGDDLLLIYKPKKCSPSIYVFGLKHF